MKKCKHCGESKPLDEFPVDRSTKDGHRTTCKLCKKEQQRQYYLNNIEYYREREPAPRNKEKLRATAKRWQQRKLAEWQERGLPLCACGCGKEVGVNLGTGRPRKFAHGFRPMKDPEFAREANRIRYSDNIPMEDFARAARKIKDELGLYWYDFDDAAGLKRGRMANTIFNPNRKSVSKGWATKVFSAVKEMHRQRMIDMARSGDQARRSIGMD